MSDRTALDRSFPDLPGAVVQLIQTCLDPDPARRESADVATAVLSREVARMKRAASAVSLNAEPERLFKGLMPFTRADRDHFHGRDGDIDRVIGLLDDLDVLVIVGPSGVGKSSFLQAGLIPYLEEACERGESPRAIVAMRPGRDPLASLGAALQARYPGPGAWRPGGDGRDLWRLMASFAPESDAGGPRLRPLLVIDQGEELFTVVGDRDERQRFAELLCDAVAASAGSCAFQIAVAVREEVFGALLALPFFGDRFRYRHYRLEPLGEAELCTALEAPVERVGYSWERGLPALVVAQVADAASPLPLLQLTASELWRVRDRKARRIRRADYERLGGSGGAVTRLADRLLDQVVEDDALWRDLETGSGESARRELSTGVIRDVILRLVDADNRFRRPMRVDELLTQFDGHGDRRTIAERVLPKLVSGRLLVCSSPLSSGADTAAEESGEDPDPSDRRAGARIADRQLADAAALARGGEAAQAPGRGGQVASRGMAGIGPG